MLKRLKQGLVALLLSATPILAQDVSQVVQLEGREYSNFSMEENTSYVGTLPTKIVDELQEKIMVDKVEPVNILDSQYTTLTGFGISWQENSKLSNCQINTSMDVGYMVSDGNSLENCVITGEREWFAFGVTTWSPKNLIKNSIVVNRFFGVNLGFDSTETAQVYDNLIGWNYIGFPCWKDLLIENGDNILIGNDYNADIGDASVLDLSNGEPIKIKGNYWYNDIAEFLTLETDIYDTMKVTTPAISTSPSSQLFKSYELDPSDYYDVVPFHTTEPYATIDYQLDTDGDGVTDNNELAFGYDPYDPNDTPDLPLSVGLAGLALAGAGVYTTRRKWTEKSKSDN